MKFRAGWWLRQIWPWQQQRDHLIGEYIAFGHHKLLLTDIALRGLVFSDLHARAPDGRTDVEQTFINIGRRELALEVIELAGERPDRLFELVPRPKEKKPDV